MILLRQSDTVEPKKKEKRSGLEPPVLHLAILLVVLSVVQSYVYSGGGVDTLQGELQPKSLQPLYTSLFQWQTVGYTGGLNSVIPMSTLPFVFVANIILMLTNNNITWLYEVAFNIAACSVGLFYLILELQSKFIASSSKRNTGAIVAFFTSLFVIFYNMPASIYGALAFLPVTLLFFYRLFKDVNTDTGRAVSSHLGFVVSLALLVGYSSGAYITGLFIFLAALSLVLLLLTRVGKKTALLKDIVIAVAIAFMLNINFVTSNYLAVAEYGGQYFNNYSTQILESSALPLSYSILGFNPLLFNGNTTTIPILPLIILAIAVVGLGKTFKTMINSEPPPETVFLIAMAVGYATITIVGSTVYGPFAGLFKYALGVFPTLLALRSVFLVLFPYYTVPILVLFAVGVSSTSQLFEPRRNKIRSLLFYLALFALISYYAYVYDFVNIQAQPQPAVVPQYVYDISSYINSIGGDFNIGVLPPATTLQSTTWYNGTNVYSSLIYSHSVFTGGYSSHSGPFSPPAQSGEYFSFAKNISEQNTNNVSIGNLFGIYGIEYVIVQGDALATSVCNCVYSIPFSFNTLYSNLNASSLRFVSKIGNSGIYRNTLYVPLVYASNLYNLGNSSTHNALSFISKPKFSVLNSSVYSGDILGSCSHVYSTCVGDLYRSGNFTPQNLTAVRVGGINYTQENPASISLVVSNATTPFYLILRETYNKNWVAYYDNGTQIDPSRHIAVNGFANAWYVRKTGSYKMRLYYTPESYSILSWAVSVAGVVAVLRLSGIGNGRGKKAHAYKISRRIIAQKRSVQ